jgi:hypothetical protein
MLKYIYNILIKNSNNNEINNNEINNNEINNNEINNNENIKYKQKIVLYEDKKEETIKNIYYVLINNTEIIFIKSNNFDNVMNILIYNNKNNFYYICELLICNKQQFLLYYKKYINLYNNKYIYIL